MSEQEGEGAVDYRILGFGILLFILIALVIILLSRRQKVEIPAGAENVVDLAVRDLAGRLRVPVKDVEVVDVRPIDWPDASLGYPEPGRTYAQVVTPGFMIKLQVGEKAFVYNSDYQRVVYAGRIWPREAH